MTSLRSVALVGLFGGGLQVHRHRRWHVTGCRGPSVVFQRNASFGACSRSGLPGGYLPLRTLALLRVLLAGWSVTLGFHCAVQTCPIPCGHWDYVVASFCPRPVRQGRYGQSCRDHCSRLRLVCSDPRYSRDTHHSRNWVSPQVSVATDCAVLMPACPILGSRAQARVCHDKSLDGRRR